MRAKETVKSSATHPSNNGISVGPRCGNYGVDDIDQAAAQILHVPDVFVAELNSVVAVFFDRADLAGHARSNLDDRDTANGAIVIEDLRHSTLTSQDQRHEPRTREG